MSEQQNQGQTSAADDSGQDQGQTSGSESKANENRTVPYHRFSQLNENYKNTQKELEQIRQQQEQADEERAKKQGEYQKLAEKFKTQAQTEKEKRESIERSWERERRLNVWVGAAAGVIKTEAISDSFNMLGDDDYANVDPTDETQVKRLAEMLVERKPYLADGPIGAGSGGSDRPLLGSARSPNGATRQPSSDIPMTSSGRMIFKKRNKRPAWK